VAMVVVMVVKVDLMGAKVEMEVVTEALVVGLCCMRRGYNIRKDDGRRKWELSSQHNFVNEDQTTNYSNLNNPAFAFAFCTTPK